MITTTRAEVLERMAPEVVKANFDECLIDLARRAKDELGYSHLADRLKLERVLAVQEIDEVLAKLGIEPFTPESVKKYQKMTTEQQLTWGSRVKEMIFWTLFATAGVSVLGLCLGWLIDPKISIGSLFVLVGSFILLWSLEDWLNNIKRISWKWQSVSLASYASPIPEFVIEKALQIKGELPDAVFRVEHLLREEVVVDPFLVLIYNSVVYYIEVWDEPKFRHPSLS